MTYGQAKKDFILNKVYVWKKARNGEPEMTEVKKDSIPDETEGVVGLVSWFETMQQKIALGFIANKEEDK